MYFDYLGKTLMVHRHERIVDARNVGCIFPMWISCGQAGFGLHICGLQGDKFVGKLLVQSIDVATLQPLP